MMIQEVTQEELDEFSVKLHDEIVSALNDDKNLAVIKAPPGSGKTYMLLKITATLIKRFRWRVAIAAQTNNQANDLVESLARDHDGLPVARLGASGTNPPAGFPSKALWITSMADVPEGPGVVIATSAKWASSSETPNFDLLAVDEAWQMAWADLMRCADLSPKFMLIGDPGQIPPVTTIDVQRWGTSLRAPHRAAPEVVFADPQFETVRIIGNLPACRRLPAEAVTYIKPFYDFDFAAYAKPGERSISLKDDVSSEVRRLLEQLAKDDGGASVAGWFTGSQGENATDLLPRNRQLETVSSLSGDVAAVTLLKRLSTGEPALATIPTSPDGPPAQVDLELARAIHRIVRALLHDEVQITYKAGAEPRAVQQSDIGICASHRSMNGAIRKTLGAGFADVRIDTPERWQGLEKPIMIAVHPLSGVTDPSEFDLSTGRLCVMASRQQAAMIFVARDHVGQTIENVVPSATQAPGQRDSVGQGRRAHLEFWELLKKNNRVVSMV